MLQNAKWVLSELFPLENEGRHQMNGQIEFEGELHHNQEPFDGLLLACAIVNVFAVDEAAAEDVLLQLLAECVNHYKDKIIIYI